MTLEKLRVVLYKEGIKSEFVWHGQAWTLHLHGVTWAQCLGIADKYDVPMAWLIPISKRTDPDEPHNFKQMSLFGGD